ncbi:MAG: serine O-acetyltransferase [Gemmatimonadales bacterium]|nr:serine O-acetyltransferase [Gemmatimonadales bacterium]
MFDRIRADIQAAMERDPAAKSRLEVFLLYPGLHAVIMHRMAHWLWEHRLRLMARFLSEVNRLITGIEIHPGARIGRGLFIDHGMGTVIGETSEIGANCTLYQGVTLGGTGKETGKRHPTLGNNVVVGVGASLLGSISVGDNALVGAGSVVLKDVLAETTVVGVPARAVREHGARVTAASISGATQDDPCEQCQQLFNKEIGRLERRLAELEERLGARTGVGEPE